jgi:hypothetical protein
MIIILHRFLSSTFDDHYTALSETDAAAVVIDDNIISSEEVSTDIAVMVRIFTEAVVPSMLARRKRDNPEMNDLQLA